GVASDGPGRGAEFVVRIPMGQGKPPVPPDWIGGHAPLHRGAGARGQRILLADDNLDFASTFAMLLRRMGNDVRVEHDGPAALAAAAEFKPQVAFLDIGLPRLNGFDLARRLRELPAMNGAKLIAVTGWGQPADRQLATEAGFDDYMVKPVEIERIQAILRL
ncbi:MAG TPA: response regulator, partial [Burkholderiales bacterium]|nr:response regulator [Burkholderiales bacterium]